MVAEFNQAMAEFMDDLVKWFPREDAIDDARTMFESMARLRDPTKAALPMQMFVDGIRPHAASIRARDNDAMSANMESIEFIQSLRLKKYWDSPHMPEKTRDGIWNHLNALLDHADIEAADAGDDASLQTVATSAASASAADAPARADNSNGTGGGLMHRGFNEIMAQFLQDMVAAFPREDAMKATQTRLLDGMREDAGLPMREFMQALGADRASDCIRERNAEGLAEFMDAGFLADMNLKKYWTSSRMPDATREGIWTHLNRLLMIGSSLRFIDPTMLPMVEQMAEAALGSGDFNDLMSSVQDGSGPMPDMGQMMQRMMGFMGGRGGGGGRGRGRGRGAAGPRVTRTRPDGGQAAVAPRASGPGTARGRTLQRRNAHRPA